MMTRNNPFDEIAFDKQTGILLDACIILHMLDKECDMHEKCKEEMTKITDKNCKLYTSNVVLSEVINKTLYQYFINDMKFSIDISKPRNTIENVSKILSCFNSYEQNILLGTEDKKKVYKIKFNKYFDKINKDKCKDIPREVLKVYFQDSINIIKDFIKKYNVSTLVVNENMMNIAQDIMVKHMLGINDAQHLATGIGHRMDYLLSCDGDFKFVDENYKIEMLRIC